MNFSGIERFVAGAVALSAALLLADCRSAPPPPVIIYVPVPAAAPPAEPTPQYLPPSPVYVPLPPPPPEPCYGEAYDLGLYNAATRNEDAWFGFADRDAGKKALELFAEYLRCEPDGSYAIHAHLRKARLHCGMNEKSFGLEELNVLSRHPRAGAAELGDARYVYDYCNGSVNYDGRPLP
jgi:hypothetical protein